MPHLLYLCIHNFLCVFLFWFCFVFCFVFVFLQLHCRHPDTSASDTATCTSSVSTDHRTLTQCQSPVLALFTTLTCPLISQGLLRKLSAFYFHLHELNCQEDQIAAGILSLIFRTWACSDQVLPLHPPAGFSSGPVGQVKALSFPGQCGSHPV